MSTPRPGQIRCPTCHRPTPLAAYCTQCGAAIPGNVRSRPRGMDRDELESRLRSRRPGDVALRRGGDYQPFEPEPEDSLAVREERREAATPRYIEDTAPGWDEPEPDAENLPPSPPSPEPTWRAAEQEASHEAVVPVAAWPSVDSPAMEPRDGEPAYPESPYPPTGYAEAQEADPRHSARPWTEPPSLQPGMAQPGYDAGWQEPIEEEEDPYAYAHPYPAETRRRGGGGVLPVVGFIVLAVMALGVGVFLSGLFTSPGTAETSPTPSPSPSTEVTPSPSAPSESAAESSTPEPTDGPIAFPDGALLSVQPCGQGDYDTGAVGRPEEEACPDDGSEIAGSDAWAFIVFSDTGGGDTLTVSLLSDGETLDEQELVLGSILTDCGESCSGLVYGARYAGLTPGEYELVLRRNGEFADSATFTAGD